MSSKPGILLCLGGLLAAFVAQSGRAEDIPPPKPFKRAIIFSGMGLDFTPYLGLYDAAVDAGQKPDLIIASSGGAVAAAIIAAYPDRNDRLQFLESDEFFTFFDSVTVESPRPGPHIAKLFRLVPRKYGVAPLTLDLASRPLVSITEPENNSFNIPFPTGPESPRILLVGARLDYCKPNRLRPGRKIFTETWFTDPDTGEQIQYLNSPVGVNYRRSAVSPTAIVKTENSLSQALRASIAEPLLLTTTEIDGDTYTGGAVDLWPVELAESLAEETLLPKLSDLTRAVKILFDGVFQYSSQERLDSLENYPGTVPIDMRDNKETLKDTSFWFSVKWIKAPRSHLRPGSITLLPRPRAVYSGPKDQEDFIDRIRIQYDYGYQRGQQSLNPQVSGSLNPTLPGELPLEK